MANTAVTVSKFKTWPLSETEWSVSENTIKWGVDYTDVNFGTTSTDTITMTLGQTPASWLVQNGKVNVTQAFAGTTAFTVTVGTTSSTSAFVTSQSVTAVATLSGASTLSSLTNATGTSSLSIVAIFTNATGGSPSALTAGHCDIYLSLLDTSKALG